MPAGTHAWQYIWLIHPISTSQVRALSPARPGGRRWRAKRSSGSSTHGRQRGPLRCRLGFRVARESSMRSATRLRPQQHLSHQRGHEQQACGRLSVELPPLPRPSTCAAFSNLHDPMTYASLKSQSCMQLRPAFKLWLRPNTCAALTNSQEAHKPSLPENPDIHRRNSSERCP